MKLALTAIVGCGICLAFSAVHAQSFAASGTVVVPESSTEKPEDIGYRSHTNILLYELREPLAPPRPFAGESTRASTNGAETSASIRSRQSAGIPAAGPGSNFFETPASLACVYGLTPPVAGCSPAVATALPIGGGRALAIVDAYDDPDAAADLAAFDTQFGIASANFQVVYASGTKPPVDPTGGWEIEESLDIEWSHAMAPNAALFLVEAASDKNTDLLSAVSVANQLVAQAGGGEVSMSWGSSEFAKEVGDESYFQTPTVVYLAGSGDSPGQIWPSVSPNIVSAGGSTISRNPATGSFQQEVVWANTGSGPSSFFAIPSYQAPLAGIIGKHRATPDLVFDADPHTGVWIYDTYPARGKPGWRVVGGTSIAAPSLAGVINSAGSFYASSSAELTQIYSDLGQFIGFTDIVSGTCYHYAGYFAASGWDYCSGVGSVSGYQGK